MGVEFSLMGRPFQGFEHKILCDREELLYLSLLNDLLSKLELVLLGFMVKGISEMDVLTLAWIFL